MNVSGREIQLPSGQVLKVQTSQPNPYGSEWSAIDSNTYDVDWEGEETGYVANGPVGWGKTEQDAIDDLVAQMEDAQ